MKLALALLLIATTLPGQAADPWRTHYHYASSAGRTAGGSVILVEYDLRLEGGLCRLFIHGFQSDQKINCTTTRQGRVMKVHFDRFADGRIENASGVREYEPGAVLFELHRSSSGVLTRFDAIKPEGVNKPEGKYFQ